MTIVNVNSIAGINSITALSGQSLSIYDSLGNSNVAIDTSGNLFVNRGSVTLGTTPFFRNVPTIASNYTITTTYNEMSIGPITINTGITVTVNTGATWTVI
jgi:hypothetical protein